MKKVKLLIAFIGVAGIIIGYWLLSPLFTQKEVHEGIEEIMEERGMGNAVTPAQAETIRSGTFVDADNFHRATGTARLIKVAEKYYVRFEDDFTVTNGPDLFVYFGKDGTYASEARLAALKGNIGSQNYEVPAGINPLLYGEVWIWCRAFSVPFGYARF